MSLCVTNSSFTTEGVDVLYMQGWAYPMVPLLDHLTWLEGSIKPIQYTLTAETPLDLYLNDSQLL
jgi:hypothetical protein